MFVKAFVAAQDFYDHYNEMKPYRATSDHLRKQGDILSRERIQQMGGPQAFLILDGIRESLANSRR